MREDRHILRPLGGLVRSTRVLCGCAAAAALAGALAGCGGATPVGDAVLVSSGSVARAASNPVTISPLPGTLDASPTTQISFLGARGTTVYAVRVVGSQSGLHAGELRAYSTGTGESFIPKQAFVVGEQVRVTARIRVGSARPRTARTSFTVAAQVPAPQKEFPTEGGEASAVQRYATEASVKPSSVKITTPARAGAATGDLFLAPYQGVGTAGPMILDQSGHLVWFHALPEGEEATRFGVQQYQGRPALVWWQGHILELGFGQGHDVIYDSSYRQIGSVSAGNGFQADLHAIKLTSQGTAWIDSFELIPWDLSKEGGAQAGVLTDAVVQEIDLRTGLVMWEWHALGHVPLGESRNLPLPTGSYPWDFAHVNSVDPGSSGDVLLSFRNTWSIDDIDVHTGSVRWRIGGSHSSFQLGAGVAFYWQHDATFQRGGRISLFDNGSNPPKETQSRGLLLRLDRRSHRVTLVRAYSNPTQTLLAASQGNMLGLPGGGWLLGYGGLPNFTEFNAAGEVVLDGTLGRGVQSFTAGLFPWHAKPAQSPSLVARSSGRRGMSVSASWNGATGVASWRVLAGSSAGLLAPVATAASGGFQTTVTVPSSGPFVAVQALDAAGAVVGTSATVSD